MIGNVKKILFPTSLEEGSDDGLRYTLHAAKSHQAKVIVLYILKRDRPAVHTLMNLYLTQEQQNRIRNGRIDHALKRIQLDVNRVCLQEFGIDGEIEDILEAIEVAEGWPGEIIVAKSRELDCDAVYMVGCGRSLGTHFALEKTVKHVLRHAVKPVLILPSNGKPKEKKKLPKPHKIKEFQIVMIKKGDQ